MLRMLCILVTLSLSISVEAKTFKIATIFPDGTSWMSMVREAASEISERTEGRVKFRFYPGGVMGNDATVLRKIRIGQLHGAAMTSGGVANISSDSQIYNIPFAFNSYAEVDYVRQRMDSQIVEGLKQKGFISFGLSGGGFAYLMSNSELEAIDDLKNQKVWSPQGDRISRVALESLGVTPIPLPLTDVLTGLQTGLINTVGSSPIGAIALQWHTRVKYLTDVPLLYLYATLVMKRKAFEKLSAQDQKIVDDVMRRTFKKISEKNRQDSTAAREALKAQGIKFVKLQDFKRQEWNKLVSQAMNDLAKQGHFSKLMLKTLREHLNDYRQSAGKTN